MSKQDVDKETMETFDKIFRIDPMYFSRCDIKSAQEVQQEQCKDKTILEMLDANL